MGPEDLVVVALSTNLAGVLGAERVLIAGVELSGGRASLNGIARTWTERDGGFETAVDAWLPVPAEHRGELERLFVEALPARTEPSGPTPKRAGQPARPRGMTLAKSRQLARAS